MADDTRGPKVLSGNRGAVSHLAPVCHKESLSSARTPRKTIVFPGRIVVRCADANPRMDGEKGGGSGF